MNVSSAFDNYQRVVNADEESIREARRRRDLFKDAFSPATDVIEVIASGSLRRGTHRDPIHDVDVVIVFDGDHHPTWGQPGASAEEALHYTRGKVNALLGTSHGTFAKEVRLAKWRNHAVKCFLDDPEDSDAFTVDAMPALRSEGKLLIPEAKSKTWVQADPEHLIASVAAKHKAWNQFAGSVRMLKAWGAEQDIKVKSLVMEVLALHHMPTSQIRPVAMKNFFVKAAFHVESGMLVEDPAGICGPIQTDLKYMEFGERLRAAAKAASLAVAAQASNKDDAAVSYWGEVFGDDFPRPPKSISGPAAVAAVPRPVKDTPQG
jgi:hypothetical protein